MTRRWHGEPLKQRHVYALLFDDGTCYVGHTDNLRTRMRAARQQWPDDPDPRVLVLADVGLRSTDAVGLQYRWRWSARVAGVPTRATPEKNNPKAMVPDLDRYGQPIDAGRKGDPEPWPSFERAPTVPMTVHPQHGGVVYPDDDRTSDHPALSLTRSLLPSRPATQGTLPKGMADGAMRRIAKAAASRDAIVAASKRAGQTAADATAAPGRDERPTETRKKTPVEKAPATVTMQPSSNGTGDLIADLAEVGVSRSRRDVIDLAIRGAGALRRIADGQPETDAGMRTVTRPMSKELAGAEIARLETRPIGRLVMRSVEEVAEPAERALALYRWAREAARNGSGDDSMAPDGAANAGTTGDRPRTDGMWTIYAIVVRQPDEAPWALVRMTTKDFETATRPCKPTATGVDGQVAEIVERVSHDGTVRAFPLEEAIPGVHITRRIAGCIGAAKRRGCMVRNWPELWAEPADYMAWPDEAEEVLIGKRMLPLNWGDPRRALQGARTEAPEPIQHAKASATRNERTSEASDVDPRAGRSETPGIATYPPKADKPVPMGRAYGEARTAGVAGSILRYARIGLYEDEASMLYTAADGTARLQRACDGEENDDGNPHAIRAPASRDDAEAEMVELERHALGRVLIEALARGRTTQAMADYVRRRTNDPTQT